MMRNKLNLLFCSLFITLSGVAQNEEIVKELDTTFLTVETPVWVKDAIKISFHPQLNVENDTVSILEYDMPDNKYSFEYEPKTIRPLAYRIAKQKPYNKNYFRAGIGAPTNYFIEGHYMSSFETPIQYGVLASYSNEKSAFLLPNTNLLVDGFVQKQWKTLNLKFSATENIIGNQIANTNEVSLLDNTIERRTFGLQLNTFGKKEDAFNYSINANYTSFNPLQQNSNEGILATYTKISKKIGIGTVDLFNNVQIIQTSQEGNDLNNTIIDFEPSYNFILKDVAIKIGGYIGIDGVREPYILPLINTEKSLIKNNLILYTGMMGQIRRNNLIASHQISPYINFSNLDIQNTYVNDKFGGIKGQFASKFSYDVSYHFLNSVNHGFFISDSITEETFNLVYDDITITQTNLILSYEVNEKWKTLLDANFFLYKLGTEERAWHLPNYNILVSNYYNIQKKIISRIDIFSNGTTYNRVGNLENVNNSYIDFNFGVDYIYHKNLSFNIDVRNILGQKYQVWNNYPTIGRNFRVGVNWSL